VLGGDGAMPIAIAQLVVVLVLAMLVVVAMATATAMTTLLTLGMPWCWWWGDGDIDDDGGVTCRTSLFLSHEFIGHRGPKDANAETPIWRMEGSREES
jgi:hypothetical protein